MEGDGLLTGPKLDQVFSDLDFELTKRNARVEIYIAGGARMITLGVDPDRTTKDIDASIKQGRHALFEAATAIQKKHPDLETDWMNDDMQVLLPRKEDKRAETIYEGRSLTVKGASKEYMLGMKLAAGRDIDIDDASTLMDNMKIPDTKTAQKIAERVFEEDTPKELQKTRTIINMSLDFLATERPDIKKNHDPAG